MKKLSQIYQRTSWFPVYNNMTTGGKARSNLLAAVLVQAIVNGLTGGIFYTGLLVGYHINIVNISILSIIPSLCSIFSLFSPAILGRFKKRRHLMSATRILFYLINIVGITLLPQLVHSDSGRVMGLIVVVFLANAVNFLFSPGYSAWHMYYLTGDVRSNYFSSTALISQISSSIVLIFASIITDRLTGDAQLNLIIVLRWVSFAVALLDVYFLQKPEEPEYKLSVDRPSILKTIKIPFNNRKFMLTMSIYALHLFGVNICGSVINTWLLEDVKVSYLYINIINALYIFFIPISSMLWTRVILKHGTFVTMAVVSLLHVPTFVAHAFVTHENYLWLMTILRLSQHMLGMGFALTVNNLIYINLPEEDQDSYISLYTLIGNGTNFVTMTCGTSVVAAMGLSVLPVFGATLSSVPILLLIESALLLLTGVYIFVLRPYVDPDLHKAHPAQQTD